MIITPTPSPHPHYTEGIDIILSRKELAALVQDNHLIIDAPVRVADDDKAGVTHKHKLIRVHVQANPV